MTVLFVAFLQCCQRKNATATRTRSASSENCIGTQRPRNLSIRLAMIVSAKRDGRDQHAIKKKSTNAPKLMRATDEQLPVSGNIKEVMGASASWVLNKKKTKSNVSTSTNAQNHTQTHVPEQMKNVSTPLVVSCVSAIKVSKKSPISDYQILVKMDKYEKQL